MSDATAEAVIEEPTETETKARDMGWRPKDEWEGDDSGWMDYEPFIERQDKRRAVANEEFKAENEKLRADLAAVKAEQAETRQTIEDFKGWQTKAEERITKKAMKDLQAQQRAAVESGDTETFDAASKEIGDLVTEAQKPVEKRQPTADDIPAYKDWHVKNAWYLEDVELTAYADSISSAVGRKGRFNTTEPAYYDAIADEVKKKFPDKFENPNRKRATGVEETGGTKAKKGKGAADLPAEVRTTGMRFVKQKLFKNIDEYAKDYFAQEE